MLENSTIIKVTNRDNGTVGYSVPDLNLTRHFTKNESKNITMEELRKLSYINGGLYILKNCLVIDNAEAVKELLGTVEPEYFYSEDDIKDLLLNGSLDAFMDCLDFAPVGVQDMLKAMAVKLEINDLAKRKAIKDILNFDVDAAIRINQEARLAEEEEEKTEKTRRVAAKNAVVAEPIVEAPARRAAAPKYKIKG